MTAQASYHQILASKELGGGEQVGLQVAAHLQRKGRSTCVWIPGAGAACDAASQLQIPSREYDSAGAAQRSAWRSARANWSLGRRLRRAGRGIVHVHAPVWYGALRWGLKLSGSARVVHVHLEPDLAGLRWAMKTPPEMVVTCAQFMIDGVRQALPQGSGTRIEAVPNAVDVERFAPGCKRAAKAEVGAPLDRPLLLMLANLAPHKGQETAIRAVAELKRRGLEVQCWLAGIERGGSSEYTARLRSLIATMGLGQQVSLLGQRSDAPALLRAADVFLLPSTHEGLPLCVLEAQAVRTPVVAAPTAGVPEVISDGRTGFLVGADDFAAYAQRIEALLASANLREELCAAAHAQVLREHQWSTYVDRIAGLYDELLGPSRARQPAA